MKPANETESNPREEEYLKIVLVGDSKVGKTTLLKALTGSGETGRGYSVSLEIPIEIKKGDEEKTVIGRIYDLRSQRYFPFLHSLYYNNAKGAIIVFDITDKNSFNSLPKWREIIWGHAGNIPLLICGNKTDLKHSNEEHILQQEAIALAKTFSKNRSMKTIYIELSAEKGIIAYATERRKKSSLEDIYPTIDAFRDPFVHWIRELAKEV